MREHSPSSFSPHFFQLREGSGARSESCFSLNRPPPICLAQDEDDDASAQCCLGKQNFRQNTSDFYTKKNCEKESDQLAHWMKKEET